MGQDKRKGQEKFPRSLWKNMNKLSRCPTLWQVSSGSESNVTRVMTACVRENCLCLEIMMKIAQCVWSFCDESEGREEKHNLNSSRGSRMVCAKFDSLLWFLLDCHHHRWDVGCKTGFSLHLCPVNSTTGDHKLSQWFCSDLEILINLDWSMCNHQNPLLEAGASP